MATYDPKRPRRTAGDSGPAPVDALIDIAEGGGSAAEPPGPEVPAPVEPAAEKPAPAPVEPAAEVPAPVEPEPVAPEVAAPAPSPADVPAGPAGTLSPGSPAGGSPVPRLVVAGALAAVVVLALLLLRRRRRRA